jgi:hypothetical protein
MLGIGPDISEVLDELGVEAVILRSPVNLVEKITYDVNGQASNPFMREFALAASFRYNTVIVQGDIVQIDTDFYLVVHKTPDNFEDSIVEHASGLLKCNIPAFSLLSPTEVKDPDTFVITKGWTIKKAGGHCLIYKNARSVLLNNETSTGKDTTYTLDCFVPASYGAVKLDRVYISPTEFYRVQDVEKYMYPGVHVLTLVEDERVAYIP